MNLAQTTSDLNDFLQHLLPQTRDLINFTVKLIQAILVFGIILFVSRFLRTAATRVVVRTSKNRNFAALIGNLVFAGMLVLAFILVLTIFTGAGFSSFLTLLGIFSVAISLAIQDVLRNFVAGVYVLLEQPFTIGDRINLRDTVEGQVEAIEIRTTHIRTDDGVQIIVPNSIIFSEIVINRTAYDKRQNSLRLTLPEGQTLTTATTAIKDALAQFPPISQKPSPNIVIEKIEAETTTARVEFYTPKDVNLASDVALAIQANIPGVQVSIVANEKGAAKTHQATG